MSSHFMSVIMSVSKCCHNVVSITKDVNVILLHTELYIKEKLDCWDIDDS